MTLDRDLVSAAIWPLQFDSDELTKFLQSLEQPPRSAIRVRPEVRAEDLPFATVPVSWHALGRFVTSDLRLGNTVEFAAGQFYIQDAASLLAVALLDPQPGEIIADLCAAPGGKSTAILEALNSRGWLLANEAIKSRSGVLQFNLARNGSDRYVVSSFDPDELARRLPQYFDAVLVDAPCSGQSLVSRGKQSASSFTTSTIDHCAARQTRILDSAALLVRPGGRLVYSTCTFAYAENEGQIESFLRRHEGWQIDPIPFALSSVCTRSPDDLGVRVWPHRHGSGGAFAACLRHVVASLRDADPSETLGRSSRRDAATSQLRVATLPAGFHDWGMLEAGAVYQRGLQCFAWPSDIPTELVKHADAGPEVAFRKANTWFPSYSLAMRRSELWSPHQQMSLNDQQARQYLQGHPVPGELVGWGVANWRGHPLGWLKGDGRQMKNHLPKAGRVT